MSTLSASESSLDSVSPAQRWRRQAAAVRVSLHWWGTHKSLTPQQRAEVGVSYAAEARFLTAGKKIIDVRHEAFRALTSLRTRIVQYWHGATLPFTEPGIRLLRQSDVSPFVQALEGFRTELTEAEAHLHAVYGQIKNDARQRLGRLYDPADYPPEVRGLFGLEWDFPAVEPPRYLLRIDPELYQQEQARVAQRFEEAVRLAEQAFASELVKLVSHLRERLGHDQGERRVFRDSAVTNLTEFFERFRRLNVQSNSELDELVEQAQRLVQGVTPQGLRDNEALRRQVAAEMRQVETALSGLITDVPRRRLVRPGASQNGGSHASAG